MRKAALFILCFLPFTIYCQVATGPDIVWQQCYGTQYDDYFSDIIKTKDDGYLAAAVYEGTDGDAVGQDSLQNPAILIKFDKDFNIEWQKGFGGIDGGNSFRKIIEQDNGYICWGSTSATTKDFTSNHGNWDFILVKTDKLGNKIWSKCYGSPGTDFPSGFAIVQDGGYLITGTSNYSGGDIPAHYGDAMSGDAIVIKTDSVGTVEWSKNLGGSSYDGSLANPVRIFDTIYQLHIYSSSFDHDMEECDLTDVAKRWIINIDKNGTILKQNFISAEDDFLRADGELINYGTKTLMVGTGNALSTLFPTETGHLDEEGAIAIFDEELNLIDEKQWGGSGDERLSRVAMDSVGNYYFLGASTSYDFDLPDNYNEGANYDYWICKTDNSFNLLWSRNFGGDNFWGDLSGFPELLGNIIVDENSLYFLGLCIVPEILPDHDINCGHESVNYSYPYTDGWLVNFDLTTAIPSIEIKNEDYTIYPNPSSGYMAIKGAMAIEDVRIFDLRGNSYGIFNNSQSIDIHELPAGLYEIQIQVRDGSACVKPFIKID